MAEYSVRTSVERHLRTNCDSFEEFYEPGVADKNSPKPFGVLKVGNDQAHPRQGLTKRMQVMVHAEREDYDDLDALCYEVVEALDNQRVNCSDNRWVVPVWTGTTGDYEDEDRLTVMRTVEFEVVIAR